jgi:predicted component of type VI protein secretion system
VTILNDSFLEDLNSTNGTYVNGQPVKKHFLQNGDVVELGKYKLKYIAEHAAAGHDAADFEKTMVLRPDADRPKTAELPLHQVPPRCTDTQAACGWLGHAPAS